MGLFGEVVSDKECYSSL